jgi:hypothetical protein
MRWRIVRWTITAKSPKGGVAMLQSVSFLFKRKRVTKPWFRLDFDLAKKRWKFVLLNKVKK